MFDGDPQARVKDRDRDRATYVIDAALRGGQITRQDRDLRVERVRAAATAGELEALTRDLAAPAVPLPATAMVPPVIASPDLRSCVRGAGYVICTILVGGRSAAIKDFEVTGRYGLRYTVGDTLGVAGISRALRTIPALIEIAQAILQADNRP